MREKLSLLSRTLSSPPSLRVSGGHLLHHGGYPLHHGGSPPLHHGGPVLPLRLGFFSSLIHSSSPSSTTTHHRHNPPQPPFHLRLTITETDPHQQPKPPQYPFHASPLSFLSTISPSASHTHRRHHNPKSLPQITPGRVAFAAFRSMINNLLSQSRFAATPSRPPPEPPPPVHDMWMEDYDAALRCWCSGRLLLRLVIAHFQVVGLFVLRPPPKPPWTFHRFSTLLRIFIVFTVSMVVLLLSWLLTNATPRYARTLFDKSPHKVSGVVCILLWVIWQLLIVTEEDYVASINCLGLSKYLSAIEYQGNWLNPENNISRNAPFRSQKSSGLDLEKKDKSFSFCDCQGLGEEATDNLVVRLA